MGIMRVMIMEMKMGKRSRIRIVLPQVDLSAESRGKPALKRTTGDFHPFNEFKYRRSILWAHLIFVTTIATAGCVKKFSQV